MQIFLVDKPFEANNSNDLCFRTSSTISSWIIDFYFQENHSSQIILNFEQMFDIYRKYKSNLQRNEFLDCCQKKLKHNENNSLMIQYENYLNRCDLIDIFDVLHRCRIESKFERIFLSKDNIRTAFDQMIFQYWSTASIEISSLNFQPTEKNRMKSTICAYLALALNVRNDYALVQCLEHESRITIPVESLSRNENLSIYQIFSLFIRQKDDVNHQNSESIKEFVDFIEQLRNCIQQMTKDNFQKTFRRLIESICQRMNFAMQNFIDEFCRDFLDCILSRFDQDFPRLLAYFHAQQTHNTIVQRPKTIRKCRSLDLSIIHETSFESDSISPVQIKRKRQALREIHVNTFDSTAHQSEIVGTSFQLQLISDEDQENMPMLARKRMKLANK